MHVPVRNVSERKRTVVVGSMEKLTRERIAGLVHFSGMLTELSDPEALYDGMKLTLGAIRRQGGFTSIPKIWLATAYNIADQHMAETDHFTRERTKDGLDSVRFFGMMDQNEGPFDHQFEATKNPRFYAEWPGEPYKIISVCPVSKIVKEWVAVYRVARDRIAEEVPELGPPNYFAKFPSPVTSKVG